MNHGDDDECLAGGAAGGAEAEEQCCVESRECEALCRGGSASTSAPRAGPLTDARFRRLRRAVIPLAQAWWTKAHPTKWGTVFSQGFIAILDAAVPHP